MAFCNAPRKSQQRRLRFKDKFNQTAVKVIRPTPEHVLDICWSVIGKINSVMFRDHHLDAWLDILWSIFFRQLDYWYIG